MIRFYAQMYDATTSTLLDETAKVYTIGYYRGHIDPDSETGQDILMFKEGQIVSVPILSDITYDYNNIGLLFANKAKELYNIDHNWHTLRLLKTSSLNDNYLEWSPSSPTGFNIKVDGNITRWNTCLQWSDTQPYECIVFIKSNNISDLISTDIHFTGGYLLHNSSVEGGTTIVGIIRGRFSCDMPQFNSTKVAINQQITLNSGNTYTYMVGTDVTGEPYNYYGIVLISMRNSDSYWSINYYTISPVDPGNELLLRYKDYNMSQQTTARYIKYQAMGFYHQYFRIASSSDAYVNLLVHPFSECDIPAFYTNSKIKTPEEAYAVLSEQFDFKWIMAADALYDYLMKNGSISPDAPGTDVDPDDIPPEDTPPAPIPPDDPDPYIDPRDPDDPTDPGDPDKQPTEPGGGDPSDTPQETDPVTPPDTPPSHAIDSHFVTLYSPSLSQLNNLAQYLWSSGWSVDTFKKILANPMDCILGLMIFPALTAPTGTKNIYVGNLDTGISMSYVTNQYVDVNCGSFEIKEYYASYLDYDPYTKIDIYLPYIGTQQLSADDVMGKTISLMYRIDLLSSACVAFLIVDDTTLYTFTGSCGTSIPVSSADWSNMLGSIVGVAGFIGAGIATGGASMTVGAGVAAASSLAVSAMKPNIRHGGSVASAAGLMSIQTPYLIITRPRQAVALDQNSYQGYPSYITQSLGSCVGYTEVEECHLEHVPATGEEVREIERLLKEGVLF